MAPKHHPTPLSGGDRMVLSKELGKARAMTNILAAQSAEMRTKGRYHAAAGRPATLRKLKRADVERRRAAHAVAATTRCARVTRRPSNRSDSQSSNSARAFSTTSRSCALVELNPKRRATA